MKIHMCKWPEESERVGPIGKRFRCRKCHRDQILGPGVSDFLYASEDDENGDPIQFVHGVFKRAKKGIAKKEPGVWATGTERGAKFLYLRCFYCGGILKTDIGDVNPDGYVTPEASSDGNDYHCLHCDECNVGNFPYLEGWKRRRKKS